MIVAIWIMTIPVGPFLAFCYKINRRSTQYKLRSIQSIGPDTELRILACTYSLSSVSGIINLLEASNPSRQSPICVFAAQLVELTGHASAMLIVHDACETSVHQGNQTQPESLVTSDNPFINYGKKRLFVSVQALTVVSPYNTMHEDICNLAVDKCINFIIIPFHMQATIDGTMEDSNPSLKRVNHNLILKAPCSVGVFVDRGLSVSQITESNKGSSSVGCRHFAMFFIGGADDREALTYAWRLAGHPMVSLTVVRFIVIPNKENKRNNSSSSNYNNNIDVNAMENSEREKQLNDLFVDQFKLKSMHKPSIQFLEETVKTWEDILNVTRGMEGEYDLYIMGKRHESTSPAAEFVDQYSDFDEFLGPLGDALLSSKFAINTSILVMQQGASVDEAEADNSTIHGAKWL